MWGLVDGIGVKYCKRYQDWDWLVGFDMWKTCGKNGDLGRKRLVERGCGKLVEK